MRQCPKCASTDVRPSRRRGLKEGLLLRLARRAPFRCRSCASRFIASFPRHARSPGDKRKSLAHFLGFSHEEVSKINRKLVLALILVGLILVAIYLIFYLSAPPPDPT